MNESNHGSEANPSEINWKKAAATAVAIAVIGTGEVATITNNLDQRQEIVQEAYDSAPVSVMTALDTNKASIETLEELSDWQSIQPDNIGVLPDMVHAGIMSPDGENIVPDPSTPMIENTGRIQKLEQPVSILFGTLELHSPHGFDTERLVAKGPDGRHFFKDIEEATTHAVITNPVIDIDSKGIKLTSTDGDGTIVRIKLPWTEVSVLMSGESVKTGIKPNDTRPSMTFNGDPIALQHDSETDTIPDFVVDSTQRNVTIGVLDPIPMSADEDMMLDFETALRELRDETYQKIADTLIPSVFATNEQVVAPGSSNPADELSKQGFVIGHVPQGKVVTGMSIATFDVGSSNS